MLSATETIDAELRGSWLATLNGCSPSTVDIGRAARRASGSALAFGRKRKHLGRSRACVTLRPSTPNYGY